MNKLISKRKDVFLSRIHEIDFLRGVLMFLVIFDHFMWFINYYIFHNQSGALNWYWSSDLRYVVRQIVLMLFLFTCGISCHLSRNNKKRGLILLGVTLFITLGTHLIQLLPIFADRVVIIDFNIIGVIAISILLYCLVEKLNSRDLLFFTGVLMLFYFFLVISSRSLKSIDYNPFTFALYAPYNPVKAGYVGDYLSLFPYVIFLFLGVLFARKVYSNKESFIAKRGNWERPICFLGRHTLFIYIAHEIIFTAIFILLDLII